MAVLTKTIIYNTFLEMLKEMPFEKITILELARRCDIAPNTFYYHFADIYDLVETVFTNYYQKYVTNGNFNVVFMQSLADMKTNKLQVQHLSSYMTFDNMTKIVNKLARNEIIEYVKTSKGDIELSDKMIEDSVEIVIYLFIALTLRFINNGMEDDPLKVSILFDTLTKGVCEYRMVMHNSHK